jgi:DNA-binding MarR family transcriptional regulator
MTDDLTESVYSFIREYIHLHHLPPTLREIAEGCHIGRSTTLRHLDRLEAGGRLVREPGKARSICLIEPDSPPIPPNPN